MTAPAIDTSSIEHLAFEVECDSCARTAVWAVDGHGCKQAVLCDRCEENHHASFTALVAEYGIVTCSICYGPFTVYEKFTKVSPL